MASSALAETCCVHNPGVRTRTVLQDYLLEQEGTMAAAIACCRGLIALLSTLKAPCWHVVAAWGEWCMTTLPVPQGAAGAGCDCGHHPPGQGARDGAHLRRDLPVGHSCRDSVPFPATPSAPASASASGTCGVHLGLDWVLFAP